MADYPTALDTFVNPDASDTTTAVDHAQQHGDANDAIEALEEKVGISASTPSAGTVLRGTGAGESEWGDVQPGDMSDTTGTGGFVLEDSPTILSPTITGGTISGATLEVDVISEETAAAGVTIDGLKLKDGKLATNNSVVTDNITAQAVTPSKLSSALKTAEVAASQTRASATFGDLATVGPSVTVDIGANGLALVIISCQAAPASGGYARISFEATGANSIGSSAQDALFLALSGSTPDLSATFIKTLTGLSAGSTTFTLKYASSTGTSTFLNRKLTVIPL
jgi:hypothetical protein